MITGELRSMVDDIWLENFSGCISDTLILIEQITYLLFIRDSTRFISAKGDGERKLASRRLALAPVYDLANLGLDIVLFCFQKAKSLNLIIDLNC